MQKYSKSHERDENRLLNKGFFHSILALILCWVPLLGLFFAISSFFRMSARMTLRHRVKRVLMTIFSVLMLILCVAVLFFEVYTYATAPEKFDDGIRYVWKMVTGQDELPWQEDYNDYSDTGFDPFVGDPDESYYDGDDPYDLDYDDGEEDYDEDYDSDFDDGELAGFDEDTFSTGITERHNSSLLRPSTFNARG